MDPTVCDILTNCFSCVSLSDCSWGEYGGIGYCFYYGNPPGIEWDLAVAGGNTINCPFMFSSTTTSSGATTTAPSLGGGVSETELAFLISAIIAALLILIFLIWKIGWKRVACRRSSSDDFEMRDSLWGFDNPSYMGMVQEDPVQSGPIRRFVVGRGDARRCRARRPAPRSAPRSAPHSPEQVREVTPPNCRVTRSMTEGKRAAVGATGISPLYKRAAVSPRF